MINKLIKLVFGESNIELVKSGEKSINEIRETKGFGEISGGDVKYTGCKPFPCGNDNIIVGTYSIAVNEYELGSTTGGCEISKNNSISNRSQISVKTKLQELDDEHMKLFGFELNSEGLMVMGEKKFIELDNLVISGPGPKCGVRQMYFENPRINLSNFSYTISRDNSVAVEIEFICDSMKYEDDQSCEISYASKILKEGESIV